MSRLRSRKSDPGKRVIIQLPSGNRTTIVYEQFRERLGDAVSAPVYKYFSKTIKIRKRILGRSVVVSVVRRHRLKLGYKAQIPCTHVKVKAFATGVAYSDASQRVEISNLGDSVDAIGILQETVNNLSSYIPIMQYDFQRNNDFELIPTLFDLDNTVDTFTKGLFRKVTYGQVTWELLPLVSDATSLYNSVRDMTGRIGQELESLRQKEKSFPIDTGWYAEDQLNRRKFTGTVRFNGTQTYVSQGGLQDSLDAMGIFLDELGIHPDLKTVWDVVPLSFVVDYFVPVGDFLESLHPRGWFNPVISVAGKATIKGNWAIDKRGQYDKHTVLCRGSAYRRLIDVSFQQRRIKPRSFEWNAPNARELFNTEYLRRKLGK